MQHVLYVPKKEVHDPLDPKYGSPGSVRIIDRWMIKQFFSRLSCKCAETARAKGFAGFSLRFYGECHGKTKADMDALGQQQSDGSLCVGDQTFTTCDLSKQDYCTGGDQSDAIYVLKPKEESTSFPTLFIGSLILF